MHSSAPWITSSLIGQLDNTLLKYSQNTRKETPLVEQEVLQVNRLFPFATQFFKHTGNRMPRKSMDIYNRLVSV